MKHIPNILTTMRMALCIPILLVTPLSVWFYVLYIMCGLSDILDGFIARKFNYTSKLGALLDSIADAFMFGVLLIILLPLISIPSWMLIWIIIIAGIRIAALFIGYIRYHTFSWLHTYLNKATGIAIFCVPVLLGLFGVTVMGCILCIIASLSALEELVITATSKELTRDVKSIFIT